MEEQEAADKIVCGAGWVGGCSGRTARGVSIFSAFSVLVAVSCLWRGEKQKKKRRGCFELVRALILWTKFIAPQQIYSYSSSSSSSSSTSTRLTETDVRVPPPPVSPLTLSSTRTTVVNDDGSCERYYSYILHVTLFPTCSQFGGLLSVFERKLWSTRTRYW